MKNNFLSLMILFLSFGFLSKVQYLDSNVYCFSERFYDSKIGQFISSDPLVPEVQSHKGLNHYSYVYNNPLKYKDPTGHVPFFQDAGGQEEPSTMSLVLDIALNIGLDILDMVADTGDYLIDAMLPPKVSQNSIYGPELFVFDKEFLAFLFGTVSGGGKTGPLDEGVRKLSKQGPKGKILGKINLDEGQAGPQRGTEAHVKSLRKQLDAAGADPDKTLQILGLKKGDDRWQVDLRPHRDAARALGLRNLRDQLDYLRGLGKPSTREGYLLEGDYSPNNVRRARQAWESLGSNYRVEYVGENFASRHLKVTNKSQRSKRARRRAREKARDRWPGRVADFQVLDEKGQIRFGIKLKEKWNQSDIQHLRQRMNFGS